MASEPGQVPSETTAKTGEQLISLKTLCEATTSPVSGAGSPASHGNGQLTTRQSALGECSPLSRGISSTSSPLSRGESAKLASRISFPGERSFSAAKSDEMSSSSEEQDEILNPLELERSATAAESGILRVNAQMERSLQTEAIELCLEVRGLGRGALYGARPLFIALFLPGSVPGSWSELDRTERVLDTRASNRFVKKIRVPAATQPDREESFCVAVFDVADDSKVTLDGALGACKISLDELLGLPMMSTEIELAHPRTGRRRKGILNVTADLVPHADKDEVLYFDFGFADDAPTRNRILFILSRAIPRGRWSPVYRSEVRTKEDLLMFEKAVLTNRELNAGNDRRLLRLEVYRYYKNCTCTLLGFCQTSLLSLRTCPVNAGIYWWPAQDGITNAKLILEDRVVDDNSSTFVLRMHQSSFKQAG